MLNSDLFPTIFQTTTSKNDQMTQK